MGLFFLDNTCLKLRKSRDSHFKGTDMLGLGWT